MSKGPQVKATRHGAWRLIWCSRCGPLAVTRDPFAGGKAKAYISEHLTSTHHKERR